MKTPHTDSCKVPIVDSNHIVHVWGGVSLPLRAGGFFDDCIRKMKEEF